MSTATSIEWTDTTWNPVRGCTPVSEGCKNCYAMRQAHRFSRPGAAYHGLTKLTTKGPRWTGQIKVVGELIRQPLRWRKPRRVFVNSMSDLFHEDVPYEVIGRIWSVMNQARHHTYQILTKRPERAAEIVPLLAERHRPPDGSNWPLSNVWIGTSVEDQAAADERIPHLLRTPAAVRFLSCEPLLGSVDLTRWLVPGSVECPVGDPDCEAPDDGEWHCHDACEPSGLHWVITGGESGPGARPCRLEWIEGIVDQCRAAGVPVFVKQLGAVPCRITDKDGPTGRLRTTEDGRRQYQTTATMLRLRDKKGGDMSEWPGYLRVREFPA